MDQTTNKPLNVSKKLQDKIHQDEQMIPPPITDASGRQLIQVGDKTPGSPGTFRRIETLVITKTTFT